MSFSWNSSLGGFLLALTLPALVYALARRARQGHTARAKREREEHGRLELAVAERTRALSASEHKFRVIFDESAHLVGLLTPSGLLLEANTTALSMAGASPEEVLGKLFWETPWWQHSAELRATLKAGIEEAAQGKPVRFEAQHLDSAGVLRTIDFSLKPVFDDEGRVHLLIPEGRDITDLRQAEGRLLQASKMESLGRLAGGVAHDFNNLLTVLIGNLSMASEIAVSADQLALLKAAEHAAAEAADLTRQMLAFGRKSMVQSTRIDLAKGLESAFSMLQRTIRENVTLTLEMESELGQVQFDSSQLQQILFNLVINARDAMPDGGQVLVRARVATKHDGHPPWDREHCVVSVQDHGPGIDPTIQEHIFEPFFTTKEPGQGTGLGLAMVYGAMLQQGGAVEVETAPGQGTTFVLRFPRVLTTVPPPPSSPISETPIGAGKTVFVIEDEAQVRAVIARQLTAVGFVVTGFRSGQVFLEQFDTLARPAVVLTDAIMPGASGFDVLAAVRQSWPGVPVLVITGYTDDDNLRSAVRDGAELLHKPFTTPALLAAIQRSLSRSRRRRL